MCLCPAPFLTLSLLLLKHDDLGWLAGYKSCTECDHGSRESGVVLFMNSIFKLGKEELL